MALDFNDHLLQPEDALVATLLRKLLFSIVCGTIAEVLGFVLGLIGNIGRGLVTKLGKTLCPLLAGLVWVNAFAGLTLVGSIAGNILHIASRKWLLLVVGILGLISQIVTREIRYIVPSVVVRRLINLGQLILRRIDAIGSVLCRVTSNVSEKDGGIAHWKIGQSR